MHAIYLKLLFWPFGQNLDYDIPFATTALDPRAIAGGAILLTVLAIAAAVRRRAPLVTAGILWYFIALSVTSSFIVILDPIYEHRLYPALAGYALALLGVATLRPGWPRRARTAGLVLVVILAAATNARNYVWQTKISLWGDVAAKSPEKPRPNFNYALALFHANRIDEAIGYAEKSLKVRKNYPPAWDLLGQAYSLKNEDEKTEGCFKYALELDSKQSVTCNNLGLFYLKINKTAQAAQYFERAVKLDPEYAEALNNLGMLRMEEGKTAEASALFERSARAYPKFISARKNLGRARAMLGDYAGAAKALLEAHQLAPGRGDIQADLGRVYLLMSDFAQAELWLCRALDDPVGRKSALENLLDLYQKTGRSDAARRIAQEILAGDPDNKAAREFVDKNTRGK